MKKLFTLGLILVLMLSTVAFALEYGTLDYNGVSRNPSDHTGDLVQFNGRVLQVIEEDELISFRIATKDDYDDVVLVSMAKPEKYSRILEDDDVVVNGMFLDLMSYETIFGATVTLPWILADSVTLR